MTWEADYARRVEEELPHNPAPLDPNPGELWLDPNESGGPMLKQYAGNGKWFEVPTPLRIVERKRP